MRYARTRTYTQCCAHVHAHLAVRVSEESPSNSYLRCLVDQETSGISFSEAPLERNVNLVPINMQFGLPYPARGSPVLRRPEDTS